MEKKEKPKKPKKSFFKKIRKIIFWILGSVFILIAIVLLLLSILFPNEKVKQILAENLQNELKREVSIQDLKFNIFTGISLKGLIIQERKFFQEKNPFFKIEALNVDYSLLPLIFGKLVLNEATIKGAEVYVVIKNINNKTRYNLDDLVTLSFDGEEEEEIIEEGGDFVPPDVKKPALPIAFSLGRIGIEDIKLNIRDYTNPVLTAEYTVDRVTALITNLTSGSNPFGITGGLQVSLSEIKGKETPKKNFNLYMGLEGKIKPFDNQGYLNPEAEIKIFVKDFMTQGSFLQTAINNGLKLALQEFIVQLDENLPQINQEIKKALQPTIDSQLENMQKKVENLKNNQGLSKESLTKEKSKVLEDFDKKIGSVLDKPMESLIKRADKLPDAVKDKAKKEIQAQKESIQKKSKEALSKELDKIITSADKEFDKQMENAKNFALKQINKAIEVAVKEAAKQLKSWAQKLEKSGLGLGFLDGTLSFDGGGFTLFLKNWALALREMDLQGKDLGLTGLADYALVPQTGKIDMTLFMNPKWDVVGFLKPFQQGDKIALPLKMTFNQKTGDYQLNGKIIDGDKAKKFALDYAVGYAERLVGIEGDDHTTSNQTDKYMKAMNKLKEGSLTGAASQFGKAGEIIEKYEKAQEAAKKAKETAKKAKDTAKKGKGLLKKLKK